MPLAHDLPDDDPTIAALGPDERALVARTWTERSACEQRAAVIFAIVARAAGHAGAQRQQRKERHDSSCASQFAQSHW